MATEIQIRQDTAANWTNKNPRLKQGEFGLETDTRKKKLGDGVTFWNVLPYESLGGAAISLTDLSAVSPISYDNLTGVFTTSMATGKLIGRSTAGTGVMEQITVGSGLSLSGGTLSATGGGGGIALTDLSAVSPLAYDNLTGVFSTSMATGKLIGRSTAGTGVMEQLTVGGGLSLSSGTLSVTIANPTGSTGQTLYFSGTNVLSASSILTNNGTDITVAGRLFVTTNSAGIYDSITLKNLNSSAPVYIVSQNSTGTEKFYMGYRPANNRFDIVSDALYGFSVDSSGRSIAGTNVGAYTAPDSGYMLTVDAIPFLGSYGVALRSNVGSGGVPIAFKLYDSTNTYVQYANITGTVISNTTGAFTGKLVFATAKAGTITDQVLIDNNGAICPVTTGGAALGTTSLKWSDLYLTNPLGVVYGGTGKSSVAANKMLVALTSNTYTETPFFNVAEQTLSTTIAFTAGTAPSGSTTHTYRWGQISDWVWVRINLVYATAGATVSGCLIPFPSDLPAPAVPTGGFNVASAKLYYGAGGAATAITAIAGNIAKSYIQRNAANTGWEFGIDMTSTSSKIYYVDIWYPTT